MLSGWKIAVVLALGIFASTSSPVHAAAKFGTPGASSALEFNPFAGDERGRPAWSRDAIVVPRASALTSVSTTVQPRTPVDNQLPILNVVDAPTVFEAPYLHSKPLYASFVVTLSKVSTKPVTVKYATSNGSGRAGIEYKSTSGTLTFKPGQHTLVLNVPILNDDLKVNTNVPHPREFFLTISNPVNAKIGRAKGSGKITENGRRGHGLAVTNALPVLEAGTGLKAVFTVSLNRSASSTVTVKYATRNGSAKAGLDYTSKSGTLTFNAGQVVKTVEVPVADNSKPGELRVEEFYLDLSNATNAVILRKSATAQIVEYSAGF